MRRRESAWKTRNALDRQQVRAAWNPDDAVCAMPKRRCPATASKACRFWADLSNILPVDELGNWSDAAGSAVWSAKTTCCASPLSSRSTQTVDLLTDKERNEVSHVGAGFLSTYQQPCFSLPSPGAEAAPRQSPAACGAVPYIAGVVAKCHNSHRRIHQNSASYLTNNVSHRGAA